MLKFFRQIVPKSLTGRMFLAVGIWGILALFIGWFVLSAAFANFAYSSIDKRITQTLESLVGITQISEDDTISFSRPLADQRFEMPYSGWYWQITYPDHETIRSRSLWDWKLGTDLTHRDVIDDYTEGPGPDGQKLRIIERDIELTDLDVTMRYIIAVDMREIEERIEGFNNLLFWAMGGLGLGFVATLILQVSFGLYPLRRISRVLSDVRAGRSRRLKRDFPREILPLVDEVNAVLEHNDNLVERARTHVGNLAHALKTPLSVMKNISHKTKDQELKKTMSEQIDQMQRHVDHHLTRARVMGKSRAHKIPTNIFKTLGALERSLQRIYADRGLLVEMNVPQDLTYLGDPEDMNEIFGNILDNAFKWAKTKISISATMHGDHGKNQLNIIFEDDGHGVSAAQRAKIFVRGKKLDQTMPGSGLGLAIVQDIVEMYEGEILLENATMGGLRVTVNLPIENL